MESRMKYIDIVFDGPPDNPAPRFVECEDETGASVNVGDWIKRDDGLWALHIRALEAAPVADCEEICAKVTEAIETSIEDERYKVGRNSMGVEIRKIIRNHFADKREAAGLPPLELSLAPTITHPFRLVSEEPEFGLGFVTLVENCGVVSDCSKVHGEWNVPGVSHRDRYRYAVTHWAYQSEFDAWISGIVTNSPAQPETPTIQYPQSPPGLYPMPDLSGNRPATMTVIKRGIDPTEVIIHETEAMAWDYYYAASGNWSESYLCSIAMKGTLVQEAVQPETVNSELLRVCKQALSIFQHQGYDSEWCDEITAAIAKAGERPWFDSMVAVPALDLDCVEVEVEWMDGTPGRDYYDHSYSAWHKTDEDGQPHGNVRRWRHLPPTEQSKDQ